MKAMAMASVFTALLATTLNAQAFDASVSVGTSGHSATTYRLALQKDFDARWLESSTGFLGGYWDAGLTYWDSRSGHSTSALSLAPVFVYEFKGETIRPYVELGVGVSGFTRTRVDKKKLGSAFQFEDRIGVGIRFGDQEIGVRAIHYSNAGLKTPNDGVESYALHYRMAL